MRGRLLLHVGGYSIVLLSEQNHCYLATVVPLPDNADDP